MVKGIYETLTCFAVVMDCFFVSTALQRAMASTEQQKQIIMYSAVWATMDDDDMACQFFANVENAYFTLQCILEGNETNESRQAKARVLGGPFISSSFYSSAYCLRPNMLVFKIKQWKPARSNYNPTSNQKLYW